MTYDEAFALLRKYNSEPFHITHALTVSNVMRRMANELGYGDEADFWAIVGLLHDIDFEQWPNEHCKKCVELLQAGGADERLIHAVVCHGYGLCVDVKPEHEMEKVLFACDELTGLIGACAKMRPSGSITDMDLKSLKKKYKSKGFAAGCSREVIAQGADMLGWELDDLLSRTLEVMKPDEAAIAAAAAALSNTLGLRPKTHQKPEVSGLPAFRQLRCRIFIFVIRHRHRKKANRHIILILCRNAHPRFIQNSF